MEENDVPIDRLVKIYRKIKEKIDTLTQEYDTQLENLKAQQDEIKFALKDMMKADGTSSLKTTFGTVSLITKTRYSTNDWDSFKRFIVEHDAVDLLEKRVAQTNMGQFLQENPGVVPPGLNSMTEFEIRITKPSK
jgi:predicted Zn-dependent peptidase